MIRLRKNHYAGQAIEDLFASGELKIENGIKDRGKAMSNNKC